MVLSENLEPKEELRLLNHMRDRSRELFVVLGFTFALIVFSLGGVDG